MSLSLDADSLVFDHLVYSRGSETLKLRGVANSEVEYKLVDANSGLPLVSVTRVTVVEKDGEFRSQGKVAVNVGQYRGQKIFIAVEAKGLGRENPHLLRSLGEIYHVVGGASFGRLPEGEDPTQTLPTSFALFQNYPNPANLTTSITFVLPKAAHVTLEVYNLLGQRVKTLVEGVKEAGSHSALWDGRNESGQAVSSGVYFYRLQANDFVRAKKMLLIR